MPLRDRRDHQRARERSYSHDAHQQTQRVRAAPVHFHHVDRQEKSVRHHDQYHAQPEHEQCQDEGAAHKVLDTVLYVLKHRRLLAGAFQRRPRDARRQEHRNHRHARDDEVDPLRPNPAIQHTGDGGRHGSGPTHGGGRQGDRVPQVPGPHELRHEGLPRGGEKRPHDSLYDPCHEEVVPVNETEQHTHPNAKREHHAYGLTNLDHPPTLNPVGDRASEQGENEHCDTAARAHDSYKSCRLRQLVREIPAHEHLHLRGPHQEDGAQPQAEEMPVLERTQNGRQICRCGPPGRGRCPLLRRAVVPRWVRRTTVRVG